MHTILLISILILNVIIFGILLYHSFKKENYQNGFKVSGTCPKGYISDPRGCKKIQVPILVRGICPDDYILVEKGCNKIGTEDIIPETCEKGYVNVNEKDKDGKRIIGCKPIDIIIPRTSTVKTSR